MIRLTNWESKLYYATTSCYDMKSHIIIPLLLNWNEEIPELDNKWSESLLDIEVNTEYLLYIKVSRNYDFDTVDGIAKFHIIFKAHGPEVVNACIDHIKRYVNKKFELNNLLELAWITGKLIRAKEEVIPWYYELQNPLVNLDLPTTLQTNLYRIGQDITNNYEPKMTITKAYDITIYNSFYDTISHIIMTMEACKEYKIIVLVFEGRYIFKYHKSYVCERAGSVKTNKELQRDIRTIYHKHSDDSLKIIILARIDDKEGNDGHIDDDDDDDDDD